MPAEHLNGIDLPHEEHGAQTSGIPRLDRAYAEDYPERELAIAMLMRIRLNTENSPLPEWLSFNPSESRSNMRNIPTWIRIQKEDLAALSAPTMFLVGEFLGRRLSS